MAESRLTLAFSTHRVETLPRALALMREHGTIFLEEAPDPDLDRMLRDEIPVEEYVLGLDSGFPLFARRLCERLKALHGEGKRILQVDPFQETLGEIHDLFGSGGCPEDLGDRPRLLEVYRAEHRWTAELLGYYEAAGGGPFGEVVQAVKRFARADAARGRLRDRLRAGELLRRAAGAETVYVEAGHIHLALLQELELRLPGGRRPRTAYLLEPEILRRTGRRRAFGPGERLTLLYTFRPGFEGKKADLLAARGLVYIKILEKEEMEPGTEPFPHTRNEIESKGLVEHLTYEACEALYPLIRARGTEEAREIVRTRSRACKEDPC